MNARSTDRARLEAVVHGSVQGVGYRFHHRTEARLRGLTGTIRNLPDGRVEVVAEGPRETLMLFLGGLRTQPSRATVEAVTSHFGPATGEFVDFRIVG